MAKHHPHILELAKRGAEARFRELVDELRLLTVAFPHLRDSFDADELPVNFILRSGGKREAVPTPKRTGSARGARKKHQK